jgi:N-methylhydantoinase B/oxoprolinase/acetone carboxylase alpha subunit
MNEMLLGVLISLLPYVISGLCVALVSFLATNSWWAEKKIKNAKLVNVLEGIARAVASQVETSVVEPWKRAGRWDLDAQKAAMALAFSAFQNTVVKTGSDELKAHMPELQQVAEALIEQAVAKIGKNEPVSK